MDQADLENVEAWAEIINHVLWYVPPDRRADVLALAIKNEETEVQVREPITLVTDDWINEQRKCDAILRIQSLLIQVFARNIDISKPRDAASILNTDYLHDTGLRPLRRLLKHEHLRKSSKVL
jgi:hypothetical protein